MSNKLNENMVSDRMIDCFFIYRSALRSLIKTGEMSLSHFQILKILADREMMSMGEISEALLISRPNLTPLIDKLVAANQIARKTFEKDRRVVAIELTDAGRDALNKERKAISEGVLALTSGISAGEKEEFSNALEIIARVFSGSF